MNVSVIIPVFNVEKYIERCVNSVIKALENYGGKSEIILTDNDSKDNSLKIIKDLEKKHPKLIRVLQCHTPGAGAVRNFAVRKAKGEYFWFIDSDDEITPDSITKLMEKACETDADFVMLGAERRFLDGHTQYLQAIDLKPDEFRRLFVRYGMGPWQLLIKRSWWLKNDLNFHEGIIHEDMGLMSSLILYTDKFASVNEPLYYYYETPNSVLHKKGWDPHYMDIFVALEDIYDRFREAGALEKYHDELEWFFIWNLLIDSAKDFARSKEGHAGYEKNREMLKKYYPNWRKNLYYKKAKLKSKILIVTNYHK